MSNNRRNALIGLFVLGGLVALGILIVKFGEERWLFSTGYQVVAKFDSVTGVREGTEVRLAGVPVGRVVAVDLYKPEDPTQGVVALMEIRRHFTIPDGSTALVVPPLMGTPTINIIPPREPSDPLPLDGDAVIYGKVITPLEAVIDPKMMATMEKTTEQIGELAEALTPAANALAEIFQKRTIEDVESPQGVAANLAPNLYTAIERLHNVLAHVEEVLGSKRNQDNLQTTLDNLAAASTHMTGTAANLEKLTADAQGTLKHADEALGNLNTTAVKAGDRVDELGDRFVDLTDKLSKLLDKGIEVGHELTEGEGTAAMLLRDPKLYNELLLTLQRFGDTAKEFMILIEQWQREGMLSSMK